MLAKMQCFHPDSPQMLAITPTHKQQQMFAIWFQAAKFVAIDADFVLHERQKSTAGWVSLVALLPSVCSPIPLRSAAEPVSGWDSTVSLSSFSRAVRRPQRIPA